MKRANCNPSRRSLLTGIGASWFGAITGCLGSSEQEATETPSPTPLNGSIPYTAADSEKNVGQIRDLTVHNDSKREHRVTISITDLTTDDQFYRQTVSIEKKSESNLRDLIAKRDRYELRLELAVGMTKTYEWPVDDSHGNAGVGFLEGDRPNEPIIVFRVEPL